MSVTVKETAKAGDRGTYQIRVKDSGIGMSKEFTKNLFQPFERERTSTVSGIQGTGLGMSITQSIVDLMGGSIEVFTEPGRGTEFLVQLEFPIIDPPAEEKGVSQNAAVDLSQIRILRTEDNMINMEIAATILEQAGITVEKAENGQIAVEKVSASAPGYYDLILMDIQMPVMDGYAATRAIRALGDQALAYIPIIAMTANAFTEDIRTAESAGMNGHIAKPIDIQVMMRTITDVLNERASISRFVQ